MTRIVLPAILAAAVAAAAMPAAATAPIGVSGHHRDALMRRKSVRHSSRGSGTGIVTGGKSTATGGTPGGMPDRQ